ncbi:MAG: hypothetical protein ABI333_10705 [bacterium]
MPISTSPRAASGARHKESTWVWILDVRVEAWDLVDDMPLDALVGFNSTNLDRLGEWISGYSSVDLGLPPPSEDGCGCGSTRSGAGSRTTGLAVLVALCAAIVFLRRRSQR